MEFPAGSTNFQLDKPLSMPSGASSSEMMDQAIEWSQQAAVNKAQSSSFPWVRYEKWDFSGLRIHPPGGLGTPLLPGDAEHKHHTLCISQYSWQKSDFPFVKCKDKNVTGFEVKQQLWSNQRLALQGWGPSAGAVSGTRKEFTCWFLWTLLEEVCSKVSSLASNKTHLLWQCTATVSWVVVFFDFQ